MHSSSSVINAEKGFKATKYPYFGWVHLVVNIDATFFNILYLCMKAARLLWTTNMLNSYCGGCIHATAGSAIEPAN